MLIDVLVLPMETKLLSEEEIRKEAAGDNKTLEEAQDLGQRRRSSAAHQQ